MGALSLWFFSFAGPRDCAFYPGRIRVVARGVDPILSRIFTRRFLATCGHDGQTSSSSRPANRLFFHLVSPDKY